MSVARWVISELQGLKSSFRPKINVSNVKNCLSILKINKKIVLIFWYIKPMKTNTGHEPSLHEL